MKKRFFEMVSTLKEKNFCITPVVANVNIGVLKEDHANIIAHGHEPNLFESIVDSVESPVLNGVAKKAGARGINLVGMCCSGAKMLSGHSTAHAGNFMSTSTCFGYGIRVANSRILIAASEVVKTEGVGNEIADLRVRGQSLKSLFLKDWSI